MAFCVLSISQLVHAFNMRSEHSIFREGIFANKYLIYSFFAGVVLQAGVVMVPPLAAVFKVSPLTPLQWLVTIGLSFSPIVIVELDKFCFFRGSFKKQKNVEG